jgi:hypothetical protein
MADTKISALTSSTTPLAGTEVLPIVQSGSTVKVAVSDLTAGRAMAALSLTTATVQATNSGGLSLKNSSGTTQLSLGAGGGDNITLSVATNITPANAAVAISPTGTGTVAISPAGALTINPTAASTINNASVGATTPSTGNFTEVTFSPGSTDATTYTQAVLKGGTATGNGIGYMKRQTTASVAASATDILGVGSFGTLVIVTGVGGGAIFSDLLMASYNGVAVISSNTQQGGPSARIYTTGSGFLKLAMVSATSMAVIAQSIETGGTGA